MSLIAVPLVAINRAHVSTIAKSVTGLPRDPDESRQVVNPDVVLFVCLRIKTSEQSGSVYQ